MAVGGDSIPPGSTGIVTAVWQHGTWAQVDIRWDNGRTLKLVVPPDEFEVVADEAEKPGALRSDRPGAVDAPLQTAFRTPRNSPHRAVEKTTHTVRLGRRQGMS